MEYLLNGCRLWFSLGWTYLVMCDNIFLGIVDVSMF